MSPAEKVQVAVLIIIFSFLSYIAYYTIAQTIERRNVAAPVVQPARTKASPSPKPSQTASPSRKKRPEKKAGRKKAKGLDRHGISPVAGERQTAKELLSRSLQKATAGDCADALQDFEKAMALDASLKGQIPPQLDSCRQK